MTSAYLVLQDGQVFEGQAMGVGVDEGAVVGKNLDGEGVVDMEEAHLNQGHPCQTSFCPRHKVSDRLVAPGNCRKGRHIASLSKILFVGSCNDVDCAEGKIACHDAARTFADANVVRA